MMSVSTDEVSNILQPWSDIRFNNDFTQLPDLLYRQVMPTPLAESKLIAVNQALLKALEIDPESLDHDQLTNWLAGNELPSTSQPLAMKYTGHQFGQYNPELGDGRGILLGEQQLSNGQLIDWHLKGAGQTPFSRFGDGRAVLRSSIREFLVGEALHHLNIPTTRAVGLIVSGEQAQRETLESCASLIRISPSHIRFGHFEFLYYSRRWDELKQLADYVIERYFTSQPKWQAKDELTSEIPHIRYRALLDCVIEASAQLVAGWQTYGFLHGVMNTDNMSIIGETFDHGPFAFIDRFDWQAVYNHTDAAGRYSFKNQPNVMLWNLSCLAQALLPLLVEGELDQTLTESDKQAIQRHLDRFNEHFQQHWYQRVAARLGIDRHALQDTTKLDHLIDEWHELLHRHKVDFQRLYRDISDASNQADFSVDWQQLYHWHSTPVATDLKNWLSRYEILLTELASDPVQPLQAETRKRLMQTTNPVYILRSHIAQTIIEAAQQADYQPLQTWMAALQQPFNHNDDIDVESTYSPMSTQPVSLSCSS